MIENGVPVFQNIEKKGSCVPVEQLLVDLEHFEISSFQFNFGAKFAVTPGGNEDDLQKFQKNQSEYTVKLLI